MVSSCASLFFPRWMHRQTFCTERLSTSLMKPAADQCTWLQSVLQLMQINSRAKKKCFWYFNLYWFPALLLRAKMLRLQESNSCTLNAYTVAKCFFICQLDLKSKFKGVINFGYHWNRFMKCKIDYWLLINTDSYVLWIQVVYDDLVLYINASTERDRKEWVEAIQDGM